MSALLLVPLLWLALPSARPAETCSAAITRCGVCIDLTLDVRRTARPAKRGDVNLCICRDERLLDTEHIERRRGLG